MALKSVKSIILNSLIIFRQKLLMDIPVKYDNKHALSLAGAYNLKQSIFPVGSIYLSINKTNPSTFLGGTWELLPANYVLKTINSGNGGVTNNPTPTKGPSDNTSSGPSDNTSGEPSNNTSGSTTLTAAQSGMPAHGHACYIPGGSTTTTGVQAGYWNNMKWYGGDGVASTASAQNASQGHTHTLSKHTHSLKNHTHTLKNHTHTTGMPANISVYAWKRTA